MAIRFYLFLCLLFCFSTVVKAVEHPLIFTSLIRADQQGITRPAVTYPGFDQAISFYTQLNQRGPWLQLPDGPLLRLGDLHPQIKILREQLYLLGDYRYLTLNVRDSERFDTALDAALKHFQKRHGTKVDGILGPDSRALLNVAPIERISQLNLNQYRIQSFKEQYFGRYIQVNIPEYSLRLMDQGEQILEMKTIVGRKKRKTPVFSTEIQALVVNPSWTVPKSIAWKDIIPVWRNRPDYLEGLKLQVVNGWGKHRQVIPSEEVDPETMYLGDRFNYFWEAPGPGNTLGRFKFMSHSQYAIYLHDTSAKRLFDEPHRAFSSGCIRVEKAQLLAETLLDLDNTPQQGRLAQHLKTSETSEIYLRQPVPVHMTYWTAWIDREGILNFRKDIYQRDSWEFSELFGTAQNEIYVPQRVD